MTSHRLLAKVLCRKLAFQQHRPHPFCASSNVYNSARVGETEGDLLTKILNIEVSEESTPT